MKKNYFMSKLVLIMLASFGFSNFYTQCPPGEVEVTVSVTTDNWGYECYWELHPVGNNCGDATVIFAGGNTNVGCSGGGGQSAAAGDPGAYASNATVTEGPWCLVDGADYVIHEVDDWGDGATVFASTSGFTFSSPGASSSYIFTASAPLANNLSATQIFNADISQDYGYSMIPIGQARPMGISVDVQNTGVNDATNVTFSYDIADASSSVSSGTTNVVSALIAAGSGDTLSYQTTYTPTATGNYTLSAFISSDSVDLSTIDDTVASTIEVTDYVWAKDKHSTLGMDGSFGNLSSNVGQWVSIGHIFMASASQPVYSIDFGISSASHNDGSVFFCELHEWDTTSAAFILVGETGDYTATSGDLGNIVSIPLFNSYPLIPGLEYLAVVGHYGLSANGTDAPSIATSGSGVEGNVLGLYSGGLYSLAAPSCPIVRINTQNVTGIKEVNTNITLGQNHPNPAINTTRVNYGLTEASKVNFTIIDINGKVIIEINEGIKTIGDHFVDLDLSNFASGVYQYTLSTNKASATKSLVITK